VKNDPCVRTSDRHTYLTITGLLAERVTSHHTEKVHPKYVSRGGGFVIFFCDSWLARRPDFVRSFWTVWDDENAFSYVLRAQIPNPSDRKGSDQYRDMSARGFVSHAPPTFISLSLRFRLLSQAGDFARQT